MPLYKIHRFQIKVARMHWLGFHDATSTRLVDILRRSTSDVDSERLFATVEPSFDETDELALKCSHYSVAEGKNHDSTPSLHRLHSFKRSQVVFNHRPRPKLLVAPRLCPRKYQRSGHICVCKGKPWLTNSKVNSNPYHFRLFL